MDFEHLILLVGTNPLPNYVVAKFFLKKNEKLKNIWFVYSKETTPVMDRLFEGINKIVKEEGKDITCNKVYLKDIFKVYDIRETFEKDCLNKIGVIEKFHFNYTGGTKMMAVQVYMLIVERYLGISPKSFSYLDAKNHIITDDADAPLNVSGDLRKEVNISFEELITLHDCEKQTDPWSDTTERALSAIKEEIQTDKKKLITIFENVQSKKEIGKTRITFFKDHVLPQFAADDSQISASHNKPNNASNKDIEWFFGSGRWLEHYISLVLKQNMPNNPLKNNMYLKRNIRSSTSKTFELDVITLNGYQVCAVSCTMTDNEYVCKLKALEIRHRATQMGGDEAKAILICFLDRKKILELRDDISKDFGTTNPILILGVKDLEPDTLWQKIEVHLGL